MGANHILIDEYDQAMTWLDQAVLGFQECSDSFGTAAARLWLCLGFFRKGHFEKLSQSLQKLLTTCQQNGYDYLFTRSTLLGPFQARILVPLLIYARDQGVLGIYPAKLLQDIGLPGILLHPGYQLKIRTLGNFQVWRGKELIPYNGWRRDKTRQLFQLLVTYRHSPLDREQFCEHLWSGANPDVALRNFKVALSTLYGVLEPHRSPGDDSAYVLREGTIYGMRPYSDYWLDVEVFTEAIRIAEENLVTNKDFASVKLKEALEIYQGEYLPEARYETWAAIEREHLAVLFLQTADHYCEICLEKESYEEVINLCRKVLAYDNCWERAYRFLMVAYDQLGDRGQVARTYQRCVETLQSEIDVSPAPETEFLFKRLTGKS
jgi:DNA-binding SARP family transcriptional activator